VAAAYGKGEAPSASSGSCPAITDSSVGRIRLNVWFNYAIPTFTVGASQPRRSGHASDRDAADREPTVPTASTTVNGDQSQTALIPARVRRVGRRAATVGALTGWLGYRERHVHRETAQCGMLLQMAGQGALDLTIDCARADCDVHRILGRSTGKFHDELTNWASCVGNARLGAAI
jgi:hypothetical protein